MTMFINYDSLIEKLGILQETVDLQAEVIKTIVLSVKNQGFEIDSKSKTKLTQITNQLQERENAYDKIIQQESN